MLIVVYECKITKNQQILDDDFIYNSKYWYILPIILRFVIGATVIFCNFENEKKTSTMRSNQDINRLKIVLAEKKRTNKWLAEQLCKDQATVSKWCTNTSQPTLEMLVRIADVLEVDIKDLLHPSTLIKED